MLLFLTFETDEERDKFTYLYERYKRLLLAKAEGILRDPMLAEDAVSEAFVRVYKNLDKIEDVNSGRTASFLVTITRNVALTMVGKVGREPVDAFETDRPSGENIEADVVSQMSGDDILALVDTLSDELRHVFLLKFAHDLSHKEIAKLLGLTENNVNVRLHRARHKLATMLRERGYVGERESRFR